MKDNTNSLNQIGQNFKKLVVRQCGFCKFGKYLADNPDFEFPKITKDLLESDTRNFVAVPGLFGGFAYYLEVADDKPVLYAEESSRMDHSSDDYIYFEIIESGSRILGGEERGVVRKKFRELANKAHFEHTRKAVVNREEER